MISALPRKDWMVPVAHVRLPISVVSGVPNLGSSACPDDHAEYLARIGQVEVEERRLSLCPWSVPCRCHDTTDGRVLADVKGSLIRREHIVRNGGRRGMNSNAGDKCRNGSS